jgi:hypothetical protein
METIRDGLYSGVGTAIQIFLQFTGAGNVAVAIVWGAMLIWDLYKVFTGKEWSWMDILFDVLGMLSGGLVKALRVGMKAAGVTKSMSMAKGVQTLAASPKTSGIMSKIGSGISTVFGWIKKAGSWLSQKLGLKWIGNVMNKAETWLSENLLKPIGNAVGLKNVGNKMLSKKNNVSLGTATRQSAVGGASFQAKNQYVYQPAYEKGVQIVDKIRGVPSSRLSDDVVDQLDAALG